MGVRVRDIHKYSLESIGVAYALQTIFFSSHPAGRSVGVLESKPSHYVCRVLFIVCPQLGQAAREKKGGGGWSS